MMPTKPHTETLTVRRTYKAPRDRLFRAWTSPAELERWFAPGPLKARVQADVRPGGKLRVEMHGAPDGPYIAVGEYREVRAPARLAFTWGWEGGSEHARAKDGLVTVDFREVPGGTEVVLTHAQLPDAAAANEHAEGWEGCLANLAQHLAA